MFGPKTQTQTYDEALEVIANGDATLHLGYEEPTKVANKAELAHRLYTTFAALAPRHMQEFICGPFGNWDGTSRGVMYDGMVFATARQPFIDALQHHRDNDGARYVWGFLLAFRGAHVLSPLYEKVEYSYIRWADGTETEYATREEVDKVWTSGVEGRASTSGSYHIRRKAQIPTT